MLSSGTRKQDDMTSRRDFFIAFILFLIGTGVMLYVIVSILSFINTTILPQAGALH